MNILIDIGHPAHVHYYRNLAQIMADSHNIIITTKDIGVARKLLEHYGLKHIVIGEKGHGIIAKATKQIDFTSKLIRIIKENKIDLAIGVSITITHAAKFCGIPSIYFDDDDLKASPLTAISGTPFASTILSPYALMYEKTKNAIYYPGLHELAYLHPKRFTPNIDVPKKYGLTENDDYFILRFNAFNAHHDIKEGGMSMEQKRELVRLLSSKGKVFITTEADIYPEFEQYKLPIPPHEIHDFLYFAKMFISDSQTMTSEAAVLGVPSFRCNSFAGRLSVIEEEEKKYGLTFGFLPRQFDWMLARIKSMLDEPNLKQTWAERRDRMIGDKIDVTAFWVWFIENYPKSVDDLKQRRVGWEQFK